MTKTYLDDARPVTEMTLAIVLVYAGYDLLRIEMSRGDTQTAMSTATFHIVIPKQEFDDLSQRYYAGTLDISDARAFGVTTAKIRRMLKDARENGRWTNYELIRAVG